MGYTHYFSFSVPRGQAKSLETAYQKAIGDCQRIVRRYYAEYDGLAGYTAHTPIGAYGGIQVNGKGDDGHETFTLREHLRQNTESDFWGFCKTARKPYDTVVTACLIVLAHRLGNAIQVSSDGNAEDWQAGLELARKVTRLALKNPIPVSVPSLRRLG